MKTLLCGLCVLGYATDLFAGGPTLDGGLSVHMVPDRFSDSKGPTVGFVVTAPISKQPAKVFHTARGLFTYLRAQAKSESLNIPRNGIWIYSDGPDYYSPASINEYNQLLSLCADAHITVWLGETTWRPALPHLHQKP